MADSGRPRQAGRLAPAKRHEQPELPGAEDHYTLQVKAFLAAYRRRAKYLSPKKKRRAKSNVVDLITTLIREVEARLERYGVASSVERSRLRTEIARKVETIKSIGRPNA